MSQRVFQPSENKRLKLKLSRASAKSVAHWVMTRALWPCWGWGLVINNNFYASLLRKPLHVASEFDTFSVITDTMECLYFLGPPSETSLLCSPKWSTGLSGSWLLLLTLPKPWSYCWKGWVRELASSTNMWLSSHGLGGSPSTSHNKVSPSYFWVTSMVLIPLQCALGDTKQTYKDRVSGLGI